MNRDSYKKEKKTHKGERSEGTDYIVEAMAAHSGRHKTPEQGGATVKGKRRGVGSSRGRADKKR